MEVFRHLPPPARRDPCALTIGNFDGVHCGHQAVLAQLRQRAIALSVPACVLTFEPHPREYFAALAAASPASAVTGEAAGARPSLAAPARISTERDKLDALARYGIDRVCITHFNASVATLAAERFIDEIIVSGLRTRHLLIGDDFRFGARRRGDYAMLERAAAQYGFELARVETVMRDGQRISSSAVRAALASGDFARAQALLGRPYFISGHVAHGRKLGRTLGFPTLNLPLPFERTAVAGVFVVRVHGLGEQPLPGVASLGTRPAVESDGRLLLEVHLFDFDADLYGRLVRVEFLHKLRDEAHFDSLERLTEQIARDTQAARAWFRAPAQQSAR
ncbi:MAG: bifunctional riboflavin kinase/FAD synthetase [Burkholderiaceae bacterium]|nr:bifunctional riboflavin kinase/FAD synthetase [Burkholderiaceae bacterium]